MNVTPVFKILPTTMQKSVHFRVEDTYADNLSKELPRIPAVKTYADFRAFSQGGRDLAHWHLNYETVACNPSVAAEEVLAPVSSQAPTVADRRYRVTKMKFATTKDPVSNITNDANLWATETMQNPKYPLELLLRVITVSLETMKLVNGLPKLDIRRETSPIWRLKIDLDSATVPSDGYIGTN